MGATFGNLQSWLNLRIGKQYNSDAEGKVLLKMWLNSAGRYCHENMPLGFNETELTSTSPTWPTISNDSFTIPTAYKNLLEVAYSTGTGSRSFEVPMSWSQSGRIITIKEVG